MKNDAVLQVRIDSQLKASVEKVFDTIGLTFADAVRMFAIKSVEVQGFPFEICAIQNKQKNLHAVGIASDFADPTKAELEKDAWASAVRKKYEIS